MEEKGQQWFQQLTGHIQELRTNRPLPERNQLNDVEEWQCRIVGSAWMLWFEEVGPNFLQERNLLHKIRQIEPDPYIVLVSNTPGLVAAEEIVGSGDKRVAFLYEEEYQEFLSKNTDSDFRWHIYVWSFFQDKLDPEMLLEPMERHPISDDDVYWQHNEGTWWAHLACRGVEHLWKWNGVEPELLEEALVHWVE